MTGNKRSSISEKSRRKINFTLIELLALSPMKLRAARERRRSSIKFTLIELLVVIGIIAILMTILLPALSQARRRTKIIACLNNEKQVGCGLTSYASDFNSQIPAMTSRVQYNIGAKVAKNNVGLLVPDYITMSAARIFYCPDRGPKDKYSYDDNTQYKFVETFPNSVMGINYNYRSTAFSGPDHSPWPGFNMGKESNRAIFSDRCNHDGGGSPGSRNYYLNHLTGGADASFKGLNVLYLDGHAEWVTMKYSQLIAFDPNYYVNDSGTQNMWSFFDDQ